MVTSDAHFLNEAFVTGFLISTGIIGRALLTLHFNSSSSDYNSTLENNKVECPDCKTRLYPVSISD